MKRPKLDGFTEIIDAWLREDADRPRKQRHTAKRVLDRLRNEMFVSLHHAPGHAQADFGEALVVIGGVEAEGAPPGPERHRQDSNRPRPLSVGFTAAASCAS